MKFSIRIVNEVILNTTKEGRNENIVTSPASINIVLNMVASGSQGRTLEQFLRFLGSESVAELNTKSSSLMDLIEDDKKSEKPPPLSVANAVFIDKSFTLKSSFRELLGNVYKIEASRVDFSKVEPLIDEVNSWAKYNTKGMIEEILPRTIKKLEPPLLLANAVHFKANWAEPFEASETRNEDFHLLDGKTTVRVPFMIDTSRRESYGSFDDFKVVRLLCRNNIGDSSKKRFCMDIILPHKRDGLQDVIEKFNSNVKLLQEDLKLGTRIIEKLWIPKWKFSYDLQTTDLMRKLGLTLPFSFPNADFTEMIDSPIDDLYIQDIFQKSVIDVNEEEAAAAAITCASGVGCCGPHPELPTFVANHPFMFMIKETVSETVIFTGAVLNPLSIA